MLRKLHAAHLGFDSMMRRAKEVIYWPGMQHDIKQVADTCEVCQERKPKNQKETLHQVSDGEYPWDRIGMDVFEIDRKNYLVMVDYFSGYIEVEYLPTVTSKQVITKVKMHCARYGVPRSIISDGGKYFASHEFKAFTTEWSIKHTFSSPYHQQANGRAEAAVKTMKTLMQKCHRDRSDPYEALIELRNTPRQDTGKSPAEVLFGRSIRTLIPNILRKHDYKDITEKRSRRKQTVRKWYDKGAKDLPQLEVGQRIFFKRTPNENWERGTIERRYNDRSYLIDTGSGKYRRNRVHLRKAFQGIGRYDDDVDVTSNVDVTDDASVEDLQDPPQVEQELAEAEIPRRSQRRRRQPVWMRDYVVE